MKLKSAPPPGIRIKCRTCGEVLGTSDEDGFDDERPLPSSRQRKARPSGKKKKGGQSVPRLIYFGVGVVVVMALGGVCMVAGKPLLTPLVGILEPSVEVPMLDLAGWH